MPQLVQRERPISSPRQPLGSRSTTTCRRSCRRRGRRQHRRRTEMVSSGSATSRSWPARSPELGLPRRRPRGGTSTWGSGIAPGGRCQVRGIGRGRATDVSLRDRLQRAQARAKLLADVARVLRVAYHPRREEHDQLGARVRLAVVPNRLPTTGMSPSTGMRSRPRSSLVLDQAAQHHGLAALDVDPAGDLALDEGRRQRVAGTAGCRSRRRG